MAKCTNCLSNDADPMWGLCFECFCGMYPEEPAQPEPTDAEYCAGYGHQPWPDAQGAQCYCGERRFEVKRG